MELKNFTFKSEEGTEIYVYNWIPNSDVKVKGVVQIAHGMAETAARYERFAQFMTENGYIIYINDHRGHGKTAGSLDNVGYLADEDGFDWLVKDLHQLSGIIKKEHPELPLFLYGHSMGSYVAQRYLILFGNELKGALLSGSNGKQGLMLTIGTMVAKSEIKKNGRKVKSDKLNQMTFGGFNKAFRPNRTDFDWLSRDNAEVDKYVNDPYCGFVCTTGFFYDLLTGLKEIEKKENIALVPKTLPILIFSGAMDPCGKNGKGVTKLLNAYRKQGISDVALKLYPEARHELLNETNRDEVMKDFLSWVDSHI
ncbi:MAG: lysophospholipase [Oscillospiraceae bacterium]|nr:lysophospholipase [Oscillospiraceae bacterium]